MTDLLTVILPTHNPRSEYLRQVLDGLRRQSLAQSQWELIIIDNKSEVPVARQLNLDWHVNARIVREEMLGLTKARVAGFKEMKGHVAVLVDDDNVLANDYLEQVQKIADGFPNIGVWGGAIVPNFEDPAVAPPTSTYDLLSLRDVADDVWSNIINEHQSTPWGAGLCVRRSIAELYTRQLISSPDRQNLDLRGAQLLYGGDTDISYSACRTGMGKGVFSRLRLEHLIPKSRCSKSYLCKVSQGRGYSEILHHYVLMGEMPKESTSFATRLRFYRRLVRLPKFERDIAIAHEKGRQQALQELATERKYG